MLRLTRRVMETERWIRLSGHEARNGGNRQADNLELYRAIARPYLRGGLASS